MRRVAVPLALAVTAALGIGAAIAVDEPMSAARAAEPVATTAVPTTTTTAPQFDGLVSALDGVWSLTRRPASSCLMVLAGDRVVYERNPDVAVMPASTMKLLTAVAAIDGLGASSRFTTRVTATAAPNGGTVDGDLVIIGGGDPVLATADWASHFEQQPRLRTPMEALADRVAAGGIREVRGAVLVDEGRYDTERYVATWPARYHNDNDTGALSALYVNDGFADGGEVLARLLRERGVTVGAAPLGAATVPPVEVAAIDSPTVAELVGAMLSDSDNGTAELLTKELGYRASGSGTTAAGTAAIAASLLERGLPMTGVSFTDGSGLDRGNRVTCRLLAAVLERAGPTSVVAAGLPVAGQTGTLHDRFLGTPAAARVRAKTGSLGGVAALAGFADASRGILTFVHVLNGIGGYGEARRVQDLLAVSLVTF